MILKVHSPCGRKYGFECLNYSIRDTNIKNLLDSNNPYDFVSESDNFMTTNNEYYYSLLLRRENIKYENEIVRILQIQKKDKTYQVIIIIGRFAIDFYEDGKEFDQMYNSIFKGY